MIDRTREVLELCPPPTNESTTLLENKKDEDDYEFISEAYALLRAIDNGVEEKACRELLETLRSFAQQELSPASSLPSWLRFKGTSGTGSQDKEEHWEAVLWFLDRRLKQRTVELAKEQPVHGGTTTRKQKKQQLSKYVPGPTQFTDDALKATFQEAGPASWHLLQQEAVQFDAQYGHLSLALRSTEETMTNITRLQDVISEELEWQQERIMYLDGEVGVTRERVEKGNKMIERAVQTKGGGMFLMSCLIVFFALLLLFVSLTS